MIHVTKGTTANVYLTLKEKQTLANPNFLFYFKHRSTNEVVAFVRLGASNLSIYRYRYDLFQFTVNTHFLNSTEGEYEYFIYEQTSTTNIDPALATNLVESGIMNLNPSTTFSFTKYQTSNTFVTR